MLISDIIKKDFLIVQDSLDNDARVIGTFVDVIVAKISDYIYIH